MWEQLKPLQPLLTILLGPSLCLNKPPLLLLQLLLPWGVLQEPFHTAPHLSQAEVNGPPSRSLILLLTESCTQLAITWQPLPTWSMAEVEEAWVC